jgi:hypothetical protein
LRRPEPCTIVTTAICAIDREQRGTENLVERRSVVVERFQAIQS